LDLVKPYALVSTKQTIHFCFNISSDLHKHSETCHPKERRFTFYYWNFQSMILQVTCFWSMQSS